MAVMGHEEIVGLAGTNELRPNVEIFKTLDYDAVNRTFYYNRFRPSWNELNGVTDGLVEKAVAPNQAVADDPVPAATGAERVDEEFAIGAHLLWFLWGVSMSFMTILSLVLLVLFMASMTLNVYLAWELLGIEVTVRRSEPTPIETPLSIPTSVLNPIPVRPPEIAPADIPGPAPTEPPPNMSPSPGR